MTTIGGVVTQAQPLLTIAPEEGPLEIDAQVQNRDAGHLRAGQTVVVKVESFDYTRYGTLTGEVLWVGADAMQDPKQGPVYPLRVRLAQWQTPNSVNGRPGKLLPGMNVTADVRVAERRLIEYFLAPLLRYREETLRER